MLSLLLAATPAVAADRTAQERAARKACLTGDYAKGVELLSDLFIDNKNTTYIFNQGRCFEQNRRYEDAIGRFEEYMRAAGASLSQEDKDIANKHIRDCRESLARERPAPSTTAPPTFVSPPPALTPKPEPSTEPVVVQPQPGSDRAGSGLRAAGIVTASVGVAGVVTGVILNLKANSMIGDMENQPGAYTRGKAGDQNTYETLAWVGYGVGAACVVTGAILYGFGLNARARSSSNVALLPMVAPGQAGALLAGEF